MSWLQEFYLKNKFGFTVSEIDYFKNLNGGTLTGIEKKYISQQKFDSLRNRLDSSSWRAIVHNKWITANYLDPDIIDQPKVFGLLHATNGRTVEGGRLASAEDLKTLVKKKDLDKFVLKHIGGGMGNQVYIIDNVEQVDGQMVYTTVDNQRLTDKEIDELLETVVGNLRGIIVQERLQVHPILSNITESGLSSIRIYTLSYNDERSKALAAFIRFGKKGKRTDHMHNGGVYAPIELDTGVVQKGLCISGDDEWQSVHPDTQKPFEGLKIPDWNHLLDLATNAADKCPDLKWVGWDLMLTPDGSRLIEGNIGDNDFKSAQLIFGGFIANGIFDEWMKELDLSEKEKNCYNELTHWKRRYIKKTLRGLINI